MIALAGDEQVGEHGGRGARRAARLGEGKPRPASSRSRPGASSCTARMTARACRAIASASRSRPRPRSAPAITAPPAAACWRWTRWRAAASGRVTSSISAPAPACWRSRRRSCSACRCWRSTSIRARCRTRAPTRGCNGVGALVTVVHAADLRAPQVIARAPFDLVLANILLRPLQRLAAPVARQLVPNARVVLSGVLTTQSQRRARRLPVAGAGARTLVRAGRLGHAGHGGVVGLSAADDARGNGASATPPACPANAATRPRDGVGSGESARRCRAQPCGYPTLRKCWPPSHALPQSQHNNDSQFHQQGQWSIGPLPLLHNVAPSLVSH